MKLNRRLAGALIALAISAFGLSPAPAQDGATTTRSFEFQQDDSAGKLHARLGDQDIFVYNYGQDWDLPHFYPLNTPSEKNLLVQEIEPYPHHRAFWVSDTVVRDGVKGDIYNGYYSGQKAGGKKRQAPFDTGVRHVSFEITTSTPGLATLTEKLTWETSRTKTAYPLLDEHRNIKIHALQDGDYLLDFDFELRAAYGDVEFISDAVHYAWPYLRLNSTFNGDSGGTITASNGATGQEATDMKPAADDPIRWIDYSNPLDGAPEGVAILQHPGSIYGSAPRKWLTREYGTFGPRRPDAMSGQPFTLRQGKSLRQRVGIYVHRGDVNGANVAEIYDRFVKEELGE